MTRFEATFVYRRIVAGAFDHYREAGRRACRLSGPKFATSQECKDRMSAAWYILKAELREAASFLNKYPVVLS